MKIQGLVLREIFERKRQLATSVMAILVGIAAIVSIKNITHFSEKAVAKELDSLGANILVLPKSASVQDYYSADMQQAEIPERYVTRLVMSDLAGLDNLSPKLSVPVRIHDIGFTLTGILPKSEFSAKAAWVGAGVFSRPKGCGTVSVDETTPKETLTRKRVIKDLAPNEILLGSDVARRLGLSKNGSVQVLGKTFSIIATLPETGTVDDSRLFAHLHTVQELAGKGEVVNAIEIVGCCNEISAGLVSKINRLVPDARVVTVTQVVDTQVRTNEMMAQLSLIFMIVIVLVGGASIANYMYANVFERRREIGTLMALGAGSSSILKMFLYKAFLLGLTGGVAGWLLGTILAVTLGPKLAGIPVLPMPFLSLWALGLALGTTLLASLLPALRASKLDPSTALQEF